MDFITEKNVPCDIVAAYIVPGKPADKVMELIKICEVISGKFIYT